MGFIFWTLAICEIDLKRWGRVRVQNNKLGADSTLGLFWRGVGDRIFFFEMLDKYGQNSDAGRQGFYFLWIFHVEWMWKPTNPILTSLFYSMLVGWPQEQKYGFRHVFFLWIGPSYSCSAVLSNPVVENMFLSIFYTCWNFNPHVSFWIHVSGW